MSWMRSRLANRFSANSLTSVRDKNLKARQQIRVSQVEGRLFVLEGISDQGGHDVCQEVGQGAAPGMLQLKTVFQCSHNPLSPTKTKLQRLSFAAVLSSLRIEQSAGLKFIWSWRLCKSFGKIVADYCGQRVQAT